MNKSKPKKRIAFVATREPEYSRVAITRRELKRNYELDEFVCSSKRYPVRMLIITLRLLWAWATGRLQKCDAVFVGFLAQPIMPLVRLIYGGPIIADAYFSLFDAMVNDKKKVRARSLTGNVCFWLDRYMLRNSDLCFTDTEQHVHYLKTMFRAPEANVQRLWIGAENKPLEKTKPLSEPFEVFFWGGFIPLQGVDTIVRAAALLKRHPIRFTIFGAGQTYEQCQSLQRELGATNIDFKGWQSPAEINRQAAQSHIALGIFGVTEKAARVIPNKAYEAMAMGLPLITRRSAAADELLREDLHCLMVDAGDERQLAEKILWAQANYSEIRTMACYAQKLFDTMCAPRKIGNIMQEALEAMWDERLQQEVDALLPPKDACNQSSTTKSAKLSSQKVAEEVV